MLGGGSTAWSPEAVQVAIVDLSIYHGGVKLHRVARRRSHTNVVAVRLLQAPKTIVAR